MQIDKLDTLFNADTMGEIVARTEAANAADRLEGLAFGEIIQMDAVQPASFQGEMGDDPFGAQDFLDEI